MVHFTVRVLALIAVISLFVSAIAHAENGEPKPGSASSGASWVTERPSPD